MYLDGDIGEIRKCDRCGKVEKYEDDKELYCKSFECDDFWQRTIFRGRQMEIFGDFCFSCMKKMTPIVFQLRDIDELTLFVNYLGRAINEKNRERNQNDWRAENSTSRYYQACNERLNNYRESHCDAQISKECE